MAAVRDLGLAAAVVRVIDREADSAAHRRRWARAGHLALARADDRKVLHDGRGATPAGLADGLRDDRRPLEVGAARYHGRPARPFAAEVEVVLHRPGRRNQAGGTKVEVPGTPPPPRLVVAEVRDREGEFLAGWLPLTNAPMAPADAARVASWYYFRRRIESPHKLLKSAGWQLEGWTQRDGSRLMRKLVIAPGACASIWALERRADAQSGAFKALPVGMSGRQVKRGRGVTTSGLRAGLWALQGALAALKRHGPGDLEAMLEVHLPLSSTNQEILVQLQRPMPPGRGPG